MIKFYDAIGVVVMIFVCPFDDKIRPTDGADFFLFRWLYNQECHQTSSDALGLMGLLADDCV